MNKIIRVAIIDPPSKFRVLKDMYSSTISKGGYGWPNVDLLCVSGIIGQEYEVKIFDFNEANPDVNTAITCLSLYNPTVAVIAIGESSKIENYDFINLIKFHIRGLEKIIIVGGTPYNNAFKELTENININAVCLSYVTNDILKYVQGNYKDLNNFIYKDELGNIIKKNNFDESNNFVLPISSLKDLNPNKYTLPHMAGYKIASIATSYGCPYKCSFCVSSKINYRYRNVDNILNEIKNALDNGFTGIFFRDNVFGLNKSHLEGICRGILDRGYKIKWVSDARIDSIQPNLLDLMRKSGCHALHFGIESSNQDILNENNKSLELDTVKNILMHCQKARILTMGYFILGLPGETLSDCKRTIKLSLNLPLNYASFNIAIPILGTELREKLIKNIKDLEGEYDGINPKRSLSKKISLNELKKLQKIAYLVFYFRMKIVLSILINNLGSVSALRSNLIALYKMLNI